jgi:hypothetical protein
MRVCRELVPPVCTVRSRLTGVHTGAASKSESTKRTCCSASGRDDAQCLLAMYACKAGGLEVHTLCYWFRVVLVDGAYPPPPFLVHSCTLQGAAFVLDCCIRAWLLLLLLPPLLARCCQALLLFSQLLCLHVAIGLGVSSPGRFAVYVSICVVQQAHLVL